MPLKRTSNRVSALPLPPKFWHELQCHWFIVRLSTNCRNPGSESDTTNRPWEVPLVICRCPLPRGYKCKYRLRTCKEWFPWGRKPISRSRTSKGTLVVGWNLVMLFIVSICIGTKFHDWALRHNNSSLNTVLCIISSASSTRVVLVCCLGVAVCRIISHS